MNVCSQVNDVTTQLTTRQLSLPSLRSPQNTTAMLHKKAQLLLGKTHYSSSCNTDIQGHSRSKIFMDVSLTISKICPVFR